MCQILHEIFLLEISSIADNLHSFFVDFFFPIFRVPPFHRRRSECFAYKIDLKRLCVIFMSRFRCVTEIVFAKLIHISFNISPSAYFPLEISKYLCK